LNLFIATLIKRADQRVFYYPKAMESIYRQQWRGGTVTHYSPSGGDDVDEPVAAKYEDARRVFLAGKWDYFMCAESDMILPPNAAQTLADLGTDVAYGLYCWRHRPSDWSAYTTLTYNFGESITRKPDVARECWGKVIEVAGVGQGCTVIGRHVVEHLPFHSRKGLYPDYCFAVDAQYNGYKQLADLSVICGHIERDTVLYPDITQPELYRVDKL
jgi:hypothetical protein